MKNRIEKFWCEILLVVDKVNGFNDAKFGKFVVVTCFALCNLFNLIFILILVSKIEFLYSYILVYYKYVPHVGIAIYLAHLIFVYYTFIRNDFFKKISSIKNYKPNKKPYLVYFLTSFLSIVILFAYEIIIEK
jgi:hypothetical protein